MQIAIGVLFGVAALINLAPVSGAFSASGMEKAYGVTLDDPSLVILMRHRAVLFGIVGGLLVGAIFRPELRLLAAVVGFVSMFSFLVVMWAVGDASPELRKIARVDVVGLVALGAGVWLDRLHS